MNQDVRNPGIAVVLSFIFNGLGQLYNGQIFKGLVIVLLSSISMVILIIGAILIGYWLLGKIIFPGALVMGGILFLMGITFICILGIYSIFDAYNVAKNK